MDGYDVILSNSISLGISLSGNFIEKVGLDEPKIIYDKARVWVEFGNNGIFITGDVVEQPFFVKDETYPIVEWRTFFIVTDEMGTRFVENGKHDSFEDAILQCGIRKISMDFAKTVAIQYQRLQSQ